MKIAADFHIHSKYSRAVSPEMTLESLDKWARIKGLHVLGTGDFTHPKWFKEIKEKLEPAELGLYVLRKNLRRDSIGKLNGIQEPRFVLTVEISCIYSKGGRVRRVHHVIFAPNIEVAEKINNCLSFPANLSSDGRPIIGWDSKKLLSTCLEASEDILFVPAHAWTPWFSIFGSKSGFNSIEECFEELSPQIFAVETGLSSDPAMNWRLSGLDKISLISNSDSHSPSKIGREANVFELDELNYPKIVEAIKSKDRSKFLYTIEFFPEEGKYHYDGHRLCGVSFSPEESQNNGQKCPSCSKPLTIGVLARVLELADRQTGFTPESRVPFKNLVPLDQIIADSLGVGAATKSVWHHYEKLISAFGNEFNVLLATERPVIESVSTPEIAEGIVKMREGKLHIEPGYDGEYGKIAIFTDDERKNASRQATLL